MKLTLVMAQTLDGKIAKNDSHSPDWTEKADKNFFVEKTKNSGVMILGRKTFETFPSPLPNRLHIVMSRKSGDWEKSKKDENVIFTSKSPQEILTKLENLNFQNPTLIGGAIVNSLFAKENLIDEIYLTISPLIFGQGIPVFREEIELNLELLKAEKIGENTILTHFQVLKKTRV